jgi:uncharacterized protein (DUF362 family)
MPETPIPTEVALLNCESYQRSEIALRIDEICGSLVDGSSLCSSVVLLKPNLISYRAPALACTHPEFIAAVARWFLDQGATVKIGDSPAFGNAQKACERHGIREAVSGMDVELVEFVEAVDTVLPCGVKVKIARQALECDLFVGLPRVKAHNQMLVTLAVKNLFGIIKGTAKARLHMKKGYDHYHFSRLILSLTTILPRQLHLIDGIEAMHLSGPMDGEMLALHLIGGSHSAVALDTAILQSLEIDLDRSPLWQVAAADNDPDSDPTKLDYLFLQPSSFGSSGFIVPDSLHPVRFHPFRRLTGMVKKALLSLF